MTTEQQEAVFRTWDSHLLANIGAFGIGVSSALGLGPTSSVAGVVANVPAQHAEGSRWILVRTDADGVHIFASDHRGSEGRRLLDASRGAFRASLHLYVGEILLMLFVPEHPTTSLKGKWGPFNRGPIRVARTVVDLAKPA